MNAHLYFHNHLLQKDLRATTPSKNSVPLMLSIAYPNHLGPAQVVIRALSLCASATVREFFTAILVLSITAVTFAQEDVAETTAKLQIDTTPIAEAHITDSDRAHWAFAPIQRHPLPPTKSTAWLRSP